MTCVIGIYFNHFTINDHLFKVYVYCLIKNKLVTHKQTLKTEVVILAVVQCVRTLSDWHQVEIFHFILTERNFLTSNVHVNASVCTYRRLHKRPTFTTARRTQGNIVVLYTWTGPYKFTSDLFITRTKCQQCNVKSETKKYCTRKGVRALCVHPVMQMSTLKPKV